MRTTDEDIENMLNLWRKVVWVLLGLAAICLLNGCGVSSDNYHTSDENKLILRLAETQAQDSPSAKGAREFARLVEQKTEGRIRIKVYDSGQLGQENSVIEQVQFGGIDFARVGVASLGNYSTRVRILTLPYVISSEGQMWRMIDGPVGDEIKETLMKEKIVCLVWYDGGVRAFYNSRREIQSPEDYRGLKISVQRSPAMAELYTYLGASVVPVPSHELYRALQSGLIDAVDDGLGAYYIHRHYEVAKYLLYDTQYHIPEMIIASRMTMMQLPRKDQEVIVAAASKSLNYHRQASLEMNKAAFRGLRDMGVLIHYLDAQGMEQIRATAQPLFNRFRLEDVQFIANY